MDNSIRDLKIMFCGYCEHSSSETDASCEKCRYNPDLVDHFELGTAAKKMISAGVMNAYGCSDMAYRFSASDAHRIEDIITEFLTVDGDAESDTADDNGGCAEDESD